MKSKNLSLRPYLKKIETHCHQLDHHSLTQLVLGLARQIGPRKRQTYLDGLLSILTDEKQRISEGPKCEVSVLYENISELRKKILERVESIEDGSYLDDPDEMDWEEHYHNEEEPDLLSSEQVFELGDYLSGAEQLFENGDKKGARIVYEALFSLVDEAEEFGFLPEITGDLHESRSRYIRCVYDLEPLEKRGQAMLAVMYPRTVKNDFKGVVSDGLPLLQDVLDIELREPKGLDDFLPLWLKTLGACNYKEDRIADLMLEVSLLTKGVKEVGRLAMEWGNEQPKGIFFLLDLLQKEEQWLELKESSRKALRELQEGYDRQRASDCLIKAGEKLEDSTARLEGYRAKFHSGLGTSNLLNLVEEASRQQKRSYELEAALHFCSKNKPEYGESDLTTRILIMSGRFTEAFSRESGGKSFGWSNSDLGLIYFGALHLLERGDKGGALLDEGLRYYSLNRDLYICNVGDQSAETGAGHRQVVTGLAGIKLTEEEHKNYRNWCHEIADKRIRYIVTNKHRRAYERAALVLTALAESKIKSGDKQGARALLHGYCKVEFIRFTAFRKEVRAAVGRSDLMRGWEVEL